MPSNYPRLFSESMCVCSGFLRMLTSTHVQHAEPMNQTDNLVSYNFPRPTCQMFLIQIVLPVWTKRQIPMVWKGNAFSHLMPQEQKQSAMCCNVLCLSAGGKSSLQCVAMCCAFQQGVKAVCNVLQCVVPFSRGVPSLGLCLAPKIPREIPWFWFWKWACDEQSNATDWYTVSVRVTPHSPFSGLAVVSTNQRENCCSGVKVMSPFHWYTLMSKPWLSCMSSR